MYYIPLYSATNWKKRKQKEGLDDKRTQRYTKKWKIQKDGGTEGWRHQRRRSFWSHLSCKPLCMRQKVGGGRGPSAKDQARGDCVLCRVSVRLSPARSLPLSPSGVARQQRASVKLILTVPRWFVGWEMEVHYKCVPSGGSSSVGARRVTPVAEDWRWVYVVSSHTVSEQSLSSC